MSQLSIKKLNRAFRKAVSHWKGSPFGFKSEKSYRRWCRVQAEWLASAWDVKEICETYGVDNPEKLTQDDYDDAVYEEMSCWGN